MNTLNNSNTLNNGQAGTKNSINLNIMMNGWLAHDNKLFDRTCPGCGGMYSSYDTGNCTKCGQQLTFITTNKNKAMSISEGTFYPCLASKQKEDDLKQTQGRGPNGVEATYRFKMFSFSDANGVLAPPPAQGFCLKGNLVQFRIINHQPIYSLFTKKDGSLKLEVLFLIYENYGDTVTFIKKAEVQKHTVAVQVDAVGKPMQMAPIYPKSGVPASGTQNDAVQKLALQLADVQKQLATLARNDGAQDESPVTVEQNEASEATAGSGEHNPFVNAS